MNRIRTFFLLICFLWISTIASAQSVFPYEEIKLDKAADFRQSETLALSAADYLLSHPFDENVPGRERAFDFLVRWTAGAQGYDFNLRGVILELADDKNLMKVYLPAMVKFCLENKAIGNTPRLIEAAAIQSVLKYADEPGNKFSLKKKTRKRLETKL